jgi:phosphoribosylglycinamide formyltransferase-1
MYKIVVLLSGNGTNLQKIIEHIESGEVKAEISAVISNRADAFGLQRAENASIPSVVLEHTHFSDREAFDQSLAQIIDSYEPDLIVLAGFMRILSDAFVAHFDGKLINIHPSLLPKYKGLHTHKRALENKETEHGATVHFVIPELDAGEIILQGVVAVKADDNEESLAERVHQIEYIIYPKAIQWLAEGKKVDLNTP